MSSRKRKSYDISFKIKAVRSAEQDSKEAAAREYGVDAKRIRVWCSQKEQLLALRDDGKSKRKRMQGAGRKPSDTEMEDNLFDWVVELRDRHLRVSRQMTRTQAKALSGNDEFKASRGWLDRFMKRHSLSLRRKTTVCQTVPSDSIPKLVSFILHLRSLRIRHQYATNCIYAMDETPCWMDMPSSTTIAPTGSRSVALKTSGHEKDHFSVVLSARADGTKLKPFIVFKGKGTRLIKALQQIPGVVVRFSANGWLNDTLTIEYLRTIIGSFSFSKRLLVWDAYRCHTSVSTRAEMTKLKLHTAVVPGGCTRFIQAPDVVWNSSFKAHLRSLYDTWLADTSNHEFTKGGRLKPASRSLLCNWVKKSWETVSTDIIKESFVNCAITTATDGSDDDRIHCFKQGQPCEEGRCVLADQMKAFETSPLTDRDDPFSSDEDMEETENNEICIDQDSDVSDVSSSSGDDDHACP